MLILFTRGRSRRLEIAPFDNALKRLAQPTPMMEVVMPNLEEAPQALTWEAPQTLTWEAGFALSGLRIGFFDDVAEPAELALVAGGVIEQHLHAAFPAGVRPEAGTDALPFAGKEGMGGHG